LLAKSSAISLRRVAENASSGEQAAVDAAPKPLNPTTLLPLNPRQIG
jgi:hypothetical protein